jgi:hypothetical protein
MSLLPFMPMPKLPSSHLEAPMSPSAHDTAAFNAHVAAASNAHVAALTAAVPIPIPKLHATLTAHLLSPPLTSCANEIRHSILFFEIFRSCGEF